MSIAITSPLKSFSISSFAKFTVLPAALAIALIGSAHAQDIETDATFALLTDFDTGAELLSIDPDKRMYPASMTKLMTAYLVFERLKNGTLSLDDTLSVSEKAWRKGGSKMFVEVGERVRVEDLLRGIIIQSGNDATIVVAEGLAGSEKAFAREMTEKAHELGMNNTNFQNASGWPDDDHYTTARDLSTLATAIIRNFPEYYHFYSEKEFTYAGITQQNRNPLLYRDIDADGLKTGHTEASGYGLTASAEQDGRRLVLVINGLDSSKTRALEGERILEWGFREWGQYKLFEAGATVDEGDVWLGEKPNVPLIVEDEVNVTLRRSDREELVVRAVYDAPIPAPIEPGQQVGTLRIETPGGEPQSVPLIAGEGVEKLGPFGRIQAALSYIIFGG